MARLIRGTKGPGIDDRSPGRRAVRAHVRVVLPELPAPDPHSMHLTLRKGFGGSPDRFDPKPTPR